MIQPKLIGRLGNNMFQIATAYAYSLKHGMDYCVEYSRLLKYFPKITIGNLPQGYYHYTEPEFSYNEIPYHENIFIEGYWQSEKYFKDYRKEVLELFNIPYRYKHGMVCFHNRLGDYKQYADRFTLNSEEYIHDALYYMAEKGFTKIFVCSDELDETLRVLTPYQKDFEFFYDKTNNTYDDLMMGSWCQHNIISASSFSWWQSWLGQNDDKITIAPAKWFPHSELDYNDIYCKNWIKL